MKLFPENITSTQYIYDPSKDGEIYGYGQFLSKLPLYLKDSEEKDKLVGMADNVINTNWSNSQNYLNSLKRLDTEISNHIATNENPFLL